MEAFILKRGSYTLVVASGPGDKFTYPEYPGLHLDLDKVFRRPVPE